MAARLKSSVLRREERGMGNIGMGRLIGAGMIGGVAFMLMRVLGMGALMIPGGFAAFILALIFTSPRHGIPLYRHLLTTLKARWLLQMGESWRAQLAHLLGWSAEDLTLSATQLLSAAPIVEDAPLDTWQILADSDDTDGFELVNDSFSLTER